MVLRMKNFNIFGVHWKSQLIGAGGREVHEKPIERGKLPKNGGGLGQFADLRVGGCLARKWGVVLLRGRVISQCTLCHANIFMGKFEKNIHLSINKFIFKLSLPIYRWYILSLERIRNFKNLLRSFTIAILQLNSISNSPKPALKF